MGFGLRARNRIMVMIRDRSRVRITVRVGSVVRVGFRKSSKGGC